jgi:FKBP-type peptidyl-prolyl cis-trans isomerase FkpA
MIQTIKRLTPALLLLLFFGSCTAKKAEKQAQTDDLILQQYIQENGLTALKTASGLYYVIENPGTGLPCNSNSYVKVSYKGYFTDGIVFDESDVQGISFNLNGVIKGWTEGIPFFKEGGNGKLLVPSALAYGKSGTSGIPANSVLIFDVKLIEVL